jgi:DNA-binding HxlR family transcriptional regulator
VSGRKHPHVLLKRLFHEPNRLAILSALSNSSEGLTFNELKDECGLTDGNLSRHLKTLKKAGTVRIRKTFVQDKPRTTIFLTDRGREAFIDYLEALKVVLKHAAESVAHQEKEVRVAPALGKLVRG